MSDPKAKSERDEVNVEELRRLLSEAFGSDFADEVLNAGKAKGDEHPGESVFERFRRTASGMFDSAVVKDALETTKDIASRGGHVVTSLYDGAKKTVTQEEAWEQMERSIEELTNVVRVQHAMILDLLARVTHLEGNTSGGSGPRS